MTPSLQRIRILGLDPLHPFESPGKSDLINKLNIKILKIDLKCVDLTHEKNEEFPLEEIHSQEFHWAN